MTATALILRKFLAPADTFLTALQRTTPPHDDVQLSEAQRWMEHCADRLKPGQRVLHHDGISRDLLDVADHVETTGLCTRVYFFADGSRLVACTVTEFAL